MSCIFVQFGVKIQFHFILICWQVITLPYPRKNDWAIVDYLSGTATYNKVRGVTLGWHCGWWYCDIDQP